MTYSITPSLLGAWEWYLNAEGDLEVPAMMDFMGALRREKKPVVPA